MNENSKLIAQQNQTGIIESRKISLESPCLRKKLCYDGNCLIRSCV